VLIVSVITSCSAFLLFILFIISFLFVICTTVVAVSVGCVFSSIQPKKYTTCNDCE
jgi:hypothetical protein